MERIFKKLIMELGLPNAISISYLVLLKMKTKRWKLTVMSNGVLPFGKYGLLHWNELASVNYCHQHCLWYGEGMGLILKLSFLLLKPIVFVPLITTVRAWRKETYFLLKARWGEVLDGQRKVFNRGDMYFFTFLLVLMFGGWGKQVRMLWFGLGGRYF